MKEPQTLWEKEQIEKKILKRREEFKYLTGRIPKNLVVGIKLKKEDLRIDPTELLRVGGYAKARSGFIRWFARDYRYHAYILPNGDIEIHTDKIKLRKDGTGYHIASIFQAVEERKRLKTFNPKPPTPPPTKKQIKKAEKRKYKIEVFLGEKLRQALALLKNNPPC